MAQRHSREITACLLRLARLQQAQKDARVAGEPLAFHRLTEQIGALTQRLNDLRKDTPLQTASGTIVGRRVNNER